MTKETTIDPKRIKLIVGPAIVLTVVLGAWKAGVAWSDFRTHLDRNFDRLESAIRDTRGDLSRRIEQKTADRWTGADMRDWGYRLERDNRAVLRGDKSEGIVVPPVAAAAPKSDL